MTDMARESREGEQGALDRAVTRPGRHEPVDERERRALLSHLRHNLRSPLNAILGYTEMLIEDAEAEGQAGLLPDLRRIHTAATQLLSRLEEALDPVRFEGQAIDLELFGTTLRHELRTPLNAVLGYSEMLLEDVRDRGQTGVIADLERVHTAGQQFLAQVDEVVRLWGMQVAEGGDSLLALAPAVDTALVETAVRAIPSLAEEDGGASGAIQGSVLVVDDSETNRDLLARTLQRQGHSVALAETGQQALVMLAEQAPDLVLLDIMMPGMSGYEVLQRLKSHPSWRYIPVIMISALGEMDSIVRCIELGAEDYLPKPFNPVLLRARTQASLEKKRLRDRELEYLEQVGRVVDAAQAVQAEAFEPESLDPVAAREDALGQLARVFQHMAREVHLREQRLKQQLRQLHRDVEEIRKAYVEPLSVYLPMDRRQALVRDQRLPDRTSGAALFADISGFTPLTAALARELGLQRGAEELTRLLNEVYGVLIAEIHRHGGSVIGFSGDAITCWLDGDDGLRATTCGLAMQRAMAPFDSIQTPAGTAISLAIKVAVVTGPVRRFLVGDPRVQNIEVIAGRTLDLLAEAEHHADRGEVVVHADVVREAGEQISVSAWRRDEETGEDLAVVHGLPTTVSPRPWPELPPNCLPDEQCRPWLQPAVYRRLSEGPRQFLAELRPAVALFACFTGIDYDRDPEAGNRLDAFVRWVQGILERQEGSLIQLTIGDKGSYLYAAFGAPVAHSDDEVRAVETALALQAVPPELGFITGIQVGITKGRMRTGAYGSTTQRTYGVLGDRTNLAARLMQAATEGILCDEAVYEGAREHLAFQALPPIQVKGKAEPIPVYRPSGDQARPSQSESAIRALVDRLTPAQQLTLKAASVAGERFGSALLRALLPDELDRQHLGGHLRELEGLGLLVRDSVAGEKPDPAGPTFSFRNATVHRIAYEGLLFVQRRHLHRLAAEWYERTSADITPHYAALAHHWRQAEDAGRAIGYLEKAGQQALSAGEFQAAEQFLQESLELSAHGAVLSEGFYVQTPADYDGARKYALERLERELPADLTYHNVWHTSHDVLPAARRLAELTGIGKDEAELLQVAAAFHDMGFTVQSQEHERVGAEIAAQVLPDFGFTPAQVAAVQGMIMATQLPQSPRTPLEEILADADLDVLGREDFATRNRDLRRELAMSGTHVSDERWYISQIQILQSHRYWTAAAQNLRQEGKTRNIELVKSLQAQATRSPGSPSTIG